MLYGAVWAILISKLGNKEVPQYTEKTTAHSVQCQSVIFNEKWANFHHIDFIIAKPSRWPFLVKKPLGGLEKPLGGPPKCNGYKENPELELSPFAVVFEIINH